MKSMLNLKALCLTLLVSTTPAAMLANPFAGLFSTKAPVVEATTWSKFTSAVSGYAKSAKDTATSAYGKMTVENAKALVDKCAFVKSDDSLTSTIAKRTGLGLAVAVVTGGTVWAAKSLYNKYYNTPERQAKNKEAAANAKAEQAGCVLRELADSQKLSDVQRANLAMMQQEAAKRRNVKPATTKPAAPEASALKKETKTKPKVKCAAPEVSAPVYTQEQIDKDVAIVGLFEINKQGSQAEYALASARLKANGVFIAGR